jgi:hypothetical protein
MSIALKKLIRDVVERATDEAVLRSGWFVRQKDDFRFG